MLALDRQMAAAKVPDLVACAIMLTTGLRLGRVFGASPQMWIKLQTNRGVSVAALAVKAELAAIKPLAVA